MKKGKFCGKRKIFWKKIKFCEKRKTLWKKENFLEKIKIFEKMKILPKKEILLTKIYVCIALWEPIFNYSSTKTASKKKREFLKRVINILL